MPNLRLKKKQNVSTFRKMAIGTWQNAYDPQVYGSMTLSHMMAKAAAAVLEKMPDANAIIRWNRIYLRQDIGVFFQVAMTDPKTGEIDLSGATIFQPEQKSLATIVDEFAEKVDKVRAG